MKEDMIDCRILPHKTTDTPFSGAQYLEHHRKCSSTVCPVASLVFSLTTCVDGVSVRPTACSTVPASSRDQELQSIMVDNGKERESCTCHVTLFIAVLVLVLCSEMV